MLTVNFQSTEPTITSSAVKLQLSCNNFGQSNVTIQLLLSVNNYGNNKEIPNPQLSIECDGSQVGLQYNNLTKNTNYIIFSIWAIESNTYYCNMT